jgi:3-deoxy-D-manno-octulosonic-acid transferase
MSPRSFKRWRKRPSVSQPLFGRFDLVLAQNERLTRRFSEIGARNVLNVGNLKLDSPPPAVDAAALEALRSHVGRRPILLAVSTHPGEDEIIADAQATLRNKHPELLTIIAPRHPERGEAIAGLLASRGLNVRRRASGELPQTDTGAYVADTMGELGTLYSLSPVAFVGGSLVAKGGQNPVEAIKLNCGVLTGHHWENFRDVYKELLRRRAVREIHSADEMAGAFAELLDNPAALADMVARASTAVDTMTGALQRTIDALATFLPADQGLRHAS